MTNGKLLYELRSVRCRGSLPYAVQHAEVMEMIESGESSLLDFKEVSVRAIKGCYMIN
jgi:hypothetical protein